MNIYFHDKNVGSEYVTCDEYMVVPNLLITRWYGPGGLAEHGHHSYGGSAREEHWPTINIKNFTPEESKLVEGWSRPLLSDYNCPARETGDIDECNCGIKEIWERVKNE